MCVVHNSALVGGTGVGVWWVCDVPHRTTRCTTIHQTHQYSVLVCVLIGTGHDIHRRTGADISCRTALGSKTDGWQNCNGQAYDMPPQGVMGGVVWCGVVWCGVVWCGVVVVVVWCGVVWCGVVWWHATPRHRSCSAG